MYPKETAIPKTIHPMICFQYDSKLVLFRDLLLVELLPLLLLLFVPLSSFVSPCPRPLLCLTILLFEVIIVELFYIQIFNNLRYIMSK
jgi:hypothetical protein